MLHILPHPGGGAETYIDLLAGLDDFGQERVSLSGSRSRLRAFASLPARWPRIAARARAAEVVHAHGDTAAILATPLLRGGPSLITTHGLHRLRRRDGVAGALSRRGMRAAVAAASETICTSAAERDELAAWLPRTLASRLVVIPNGVAATPLPSPPARARERARLGIGDEQLVALFAGRLEPRKDPLAAVEAVVLARAGGADVVLLVAGDGPLEPAVAARAGPAVRPLGFRSDMAGLLAAADVFVLPSRREGMSLSLLEAMAHGLAVIVADAPGNVEAVGEAGVVVPPNAEALARALGDLANDPGRRSRLSAAARQRVATELSEERFRARTAAAYERAIGNRS